MTDRARLAGSRAIVTGADSGIGEAIVRTLVKQGAQVFAVDRPETGIESRFKSLQRVTPYAATVTDETTAAEMIERAHKAFDGLDIVVNNAVIQPRIPLGDSDQAELEQFLERIDDLYAVMSRLAMPYLETSPAGRIINMGCNRSIFSCAGDAAYARSIAVLAELTEKLAAEAGPNGTTVNYVQPGAVMTPASRPVFAKDMELRDHCIAQSAARRLGEPVDIAKVTSFLAGGDAVFVSGTGIVVDGGRT